MSMSNIPILPENISRIKDDESFCFSCHAGLGCFTECCRMLELALTPYDVLRLRKATGLPSSQLLSDYIITEQQPGEAFPRLYLTMIDNGRASCVFVGNGGCSVYAHRPGACRAYPLGRAVTSTPRGIKEQLVIIKESHCQGFLATEEHTPRSYFRDQELTVYSSFNDAVMNILQHPAIRNGFIPSQGDVNLFILALYDLDTFRRMLFEGLLDNTVILETEKDRLQDDEKLLSFGIQFLLRHVFAPFTCDREQIAI